MDLERAFEEADKIRAEFGLDGGGIDKTAEQWSRLCETLPRATERAVADSWRLWFVTTNQLGAGNNNASTKPCSPEHCTAVSKIDTHFFAVDDDRVEATEGRALLADLRAPCGARIHACTRFCLERASTPELHARSLDREFIAAGVTLARDDGHVYWCDAHTRVHACGDGPCGQTYVDERGFEKCVLSGRVVAAPLVHAFGDGTDEALDEKSAANSVELANVLAASRLASDERAVAAANRGIAMVRRRRRSRVRGVREHGSAFERARLLQTNGEPRERGEKRKAVEVEVDQDHWSVIRFDERPEANTFGFAARELSAAYRACYDVVGKLLFSAERGAIERKRAAAMDEQARRRVVNYRQEEHKHGRVVLLEEARRRHDEEMEPYFRPPSIILGEGWCDRLIAYYAMVVVEFCVAVRMLARQVVDSCKRRRLLLSERPRDKKRREAIDKQSDFAASLLNYADRNMVASVLDLLRRGYRDFGVDIFVSDVLLRSIYFESGTLPQLGVSEKTCTHVTRDLKQTVAAARDIQLPLGSLKGTQINFNEVVRGDESVVELFLARRRARLYEGREGGAAPLKPPEGALPPKTPVSLEGARPKLFV